MTETGVAPPKQGELVSRSHQEGIFEVVGVNAVMQTANIRLEDGSGHVIPNIPWTALTVSRGLQLSGHADRQSILGEVMENSDRAGRARKGAGGRVPRG
jgi:hypothetical protein